MNTLTIDFKYDVGEEVWFIDDSKKVHKSTIEVVYFDFYIQNS